MVCLRGLELESWSICPRDEWRGMGAVSCFSGLLRSWVVGTSMGLYTRAQVVAYRDKKYGGLGEDEEILKGRVAEQEWLER